MTGGAMAPEAGLAPAQGLAGRSVHVKVPATSANVGPGFDTLGLALARYDELDISVIDSGLEIEVHGVVDQRRTRRQINIVVTKLDPARFGYTRRLSRRSHHRKDALQPQGRTLFEPGQKAGRHGA